MNDNHNIGFIFVLTVLHFGHFIFRQMWDAFRYDKAGKGKAAKLDEMIASIKDRRSVFTPAFNTSIYELATRMYDIIDVDKDGMLSPWEHATFIKCRGVRAKDARKSFAAVDCNHDGVIEFNEFTYGAKEFFNTNDENSPSKLFFNPLD